MKPSILTKINCLQLQQYEKVCLLDADVVFSRSMDAILEVQTPADLPQLLGALSEFIPFRLANWRCRPCDPIARAFEEKDGFLVSGSPILLPTGADIFVNVKTPSKTYRRNMKYDRMEFVHWVRRDHDNYVLHQREEDWRYVGLDYACIHGRTSNQDRVCTTIYIRSLGPCRYIHGHRYSKSLMWGFGRNLNSRAFILQRMSWSWLQNWKQTL